MQNFTLSLKNISKNFGSKAVLDNADLLLKSGEITSIVSPNGKGKTVTVNIIAGFMSQNSGEVVFSKGLDFKDVSVVFGGDKNLYLKNTVEENLYYFAMLKGLNKKEIAENIEKYKKFIADYDTMKNTLCEKLSYGQKRMAAIFVSLITESKIIILDEAMEGLDQKNINLIASGLKNIKNERIIIICSHDYSFVESISDEVYFLKDRKFSPIKTEESLREAFLTAYGD